MKFSIRKRIFSILMVLMLILSYAVIASGTTSDDLNKAKEKQSDTQQKLKDTKNLLSQLEKDKTDALSYINVLDQKMDEINEMIYDLNQQIDAKQAEIVDNEALLEQAQIDSADQYASMKLRIQYMYEHKSESYLEVLLASQDMGNMLNKAEYINKITSYDREMLIKYAETEKTIQDTKVLLQNEYNELEDSMASLEERKSSLELVQSAQKTEYANIKSKASEAAAYQAQLDKAEKDLQVKITEMVAEISNQEETGGSGTKINYDGGTFAWPVPVSTTITSGFGYRKNPLTGLNEFHNGVDIAPHAYKVQGDEIVAAYDGKVTKCEYAGTAGYWIWINHGNGLFTVYMHTLKQYVKVGTIVKKGQKIALMGGNPSSTSGSSTGAHLHFGVYLNNGYVDPMRYFKK